MRLSHARAAGGVLGLLAVALFAAGCGAGGYKTTTLTFTEKDTNNFGFVSHFGPPEVKMGPDGPDQLAVGDILTFSNLLLDSSKKSVGEIDASCHVLGSGTFDTVPVSCFANVRVPGGTLVIAAGGKLFSTASFTGSIVGGTGSYTAAGGTFTIKQTGENSPSVDTFHIQIPKK